MAAPGEVTGLVFKGRSVLEWTSQASTSGTATVYDVMQGLLSQFPVGSGASETCVASGVAAAGGECPPPVHDESQFAGETGRSAAEVSRRGEVLHHPDGRSDSSHVVRSAVRASALSRNVEFA